MKIKKVNPKTKYLYHYTLKENVESILKDKAIISKDEYVFFTESLNDSIKAFESELLAPGKLYIDIDGNLKRRDKVNKENYCILKIPFIDDNNFYTFSFDNQRDDSIYSISLTHKGTYSFDKAKILEIPDYKKINPFKRIIATAAISSILLFPYNTFAASWLDTNNYDTSWYVETTNYYDINNAKELAGLAYLVNKENITFENKHFNINADIDLTENKWEVIKDIFSGYICGSHRILLNYLDKDLFSNKTYNKLSYLYEVRLDTYRTTKVEIKSPYTVQLLKEKLNAKYVFFKNKELTDDTLLTSLDLDENELLEVFENKFKYVINYKGDKFPFNFETGESIENVKEMYSSRTKLPKERLVIKFKDKVLKDERTLADYNIQRTEDIYAYFMANIKASVSDGGKYELSTTEALSGDEVTLKLIPEDGYELKSVLINGKENLNLVKDNILKFICGEEDIDIKISYKLKENKETEEEKENESEIENPKTSDNIFFYIIGLIVSIFGIIINKIKLIKSK